MTDALVAKLFDLAERVGQLETANRMLAEAINGRLGALETDLQQRKTDREQAERREMADLRRLTERQEG